MEEKDGGEKVRLGMVVSYRINSVSLPVELTEYTGYSRKFRGDARGFGENRRRPREQRGLKHQPHEPARNLFRGDLDGESGR